MVISYRPGCVFRQLTISSLCIHSWRQPQDINNKNKLFSTPTCRTLPQEFKNNNNSTKASRLSVFAQTFVVLLEADCVYCLEHACFSPLSNLLVSPSETFWKVTGEAIGIPILLLAQELRMIARQAFPPILENIRLTHVTHRA